MSDAFPCDVFLSHNQHDKPRVRVLAERLREAGLRVWLDEWVVKPGDIITLAVEVGLEQSRTLVLCLSERALTSTRVKLERSTAIHRDPANTGRRFIPLLLSDCDLPDRLRRYKYVDFREEAEGTFAELLGTLTAENAATKRRLDLSQPAMMTSIGAMRHKAKRQTTPNLALWRPCATQCWRS